MIISINANSIKSCLINNKRKFTIAYQNTKRISLMSDKNMPYEYSCRAIITTDVYLVYMFTPMY